MDEEYTQIMSHIQCDFGDDFATEKYPTCTKVFVTVCGAYTRLYIRLDTFVLPDSCHSKKK